MTDITTEPSWVRAIVSYVAVEHLTHLTHQRRGCIPVPSLATHLCATTRLRRTFATSATIEEVADFLRRAPLNVSHLGTGSPTGHPDDFGCEFVTKMLRRYPCHAFLTSLDVRCDAVSCEAAAALLEAGRGLRHLRRLRMSHDGGMHIAHAVHRTLRSMRVHNLDAAEVDLTAFAALRHVDGMFCCNALTSVRLPPSVTSLGNSAFSSNPLLTSLDLSVCPIKTIGMGFVDHSAVTQLAFPRTLCSIGQAAFQRSIIVSVDLSNTVLESVSGFFMSHNRLLTTLRMPATLRRIGTHAFFCCESLAALDLAATALEDVGEMFMPQCTSLTAVLLPATLRRVGKGAFMMCTALQHLDLSHTSVVLEDEGRQFARNCRSLTSALLPTSAVVTHAFLGCIKLPLAIAAAKAAKLKKNQKKRSR
jgi:hypothetical protein